MSCWHVPKNSCDGEAAVSDCAVGRSCSPPTALIKSMMGNDWLTTQLHAHWFRQPWSCVLCYFFLYLVSCDYVFQLCMRIPKCYISVWNMWFLSYFSKNVKYKFASCQCLHLLGHLLWLTGKCVQLNWSRILLDGYKKLSLSRQPLCEALLVRRPKSVKIIDSTVRLAE